MGALDNIKLGEEVYWSVIERYKTCYFLPNLMKQSNSGIYYDKQYVCASFCTKMLLILEMECFLFCKKVTRKCLEKKQKKGSKKSTDGDKKTKKGE